MKPDDAIHILDIQTPAIQILDRLTHLPPASDNGCLTLIAERDWIIRGPEVALLDIYEAFGKSLCEVLSADLLLIRFGNAVGYFDVPHLGRLEVVSGKWNQTHFDQMLADIMAESSALPFSAGSGGALPYDRAVAGRQDVLYQAFVYLRYVLSDRAPASKRLRPALHLILRDPHRQFDRYRHRVPVDQVRRVSVLGLMQAVSDPGPLLQAHPAASRRLPLARALRGYLPEEMLQEDLRSTVDTPENRFVLMFLRFAEGIIAGVTEAVAGQAKDLFAARLLRDCNEMTQVLAPIRRHPLWQEVGTMVHLPASSTVLQRRRGYREVLSHFSKMRLATRLPLSPKQAQDLLEAKDIALLYELWTFFTVVRAIKAILGPPLRADVLKVNSWQVSVSHSFEVSWGDGTTLYYNRSFSRSASADWRSYSVPLRPDITLKVPTGANEGLHLFDAKFKLDRIDTILSEAEEMPADAAAELQGTFKRADLYKMHTYHDAISGAKTVWIIYPGTTLRLFGTDGKTYEAADKMPKGGVTGVGAIPLQPTANPSDLLDHILRALFGL